MDQRALVLIVDDDRLMRRIAAAALDPARFRVLEAGDGREALGLAAMRPPDVVLLDALMPTMDGYECCRRLRQMPGLEQIPILMITGVEDDESIDKAFEVGATDHITKPVRPRSLRNRVNTLIRALEVERKIRRAKREWEATFDAVSDLILLTDELGLVLRCNRAAITRFGRSYQEILGQPLKRLLWGDQPEEATLNEGSAVDVEFPQLDGWFRHNVYELPSDIGDARTVHVLRDNTQRKRAEDNLRASQIRFRRLFEEAPVMYLQLRDEGSTPVIEQVNQAFLSTLGYRKEEVLGRSLGQFYPERLHEALMAGWRITLDQPYTAERQLVRSDGELVDVILKTQPERDLDGQVVSVRAMFTDITELKQLQSKIVASQKLADLGTLAAGVAHEMNSPLQVITGMSQSLLKARERGTLTDERLRDSLDTINRNAWRCAEIARALRTYAHSAGGLMEPLDLNSVIRDALLLTEHQLRSWSNIEIETDLADILPPMLCDRNQIAQVLINLLTNARDAMPGGGRITIRTRLNADGQSLLLQVADSGCGIPPEVLAKIFNPFFTTKPVGKGTGLGLSIIKGIVQAHGGRIWLESGEGVGTTFFLEFPPYLQDNLVDVPTVEPVGRFEEGRTQK